jgi:hypothetical protein
VDEKQISQNDDAVAAFLAGDMTSFDPADIANPTVRKTGSNRHGMA